jgi:hypothetical protein
MEEVSAAIIFLIAIAYFVTRLVVFANAARRKERSASQDREKEQD